MDSFDYQRSSLPSRLPATRGSYLPAQRLSSAGASEAVAPSPLSVRAVFRASRRYWWLILALWTVGVSGLGALIYLKVQPQFHSMALLKVDPNELDLYGSANQFGGTSYMQTYVEMIKAPSVFAAAVTDPKVARCALIRNAGDTTQALTKAINVGIRTNTTLIEVSMISPSADEATTIVEAVVDKFLKANKSWSNGALEVQVNKLKEYQAGLKAQSAVLEGQIEALARNGARVDRVVRRDKPEPAPGAAPPAPETDINVDHYKLMFEKLMTTKTELVLAESQLIQAQRALEEVNRQAASSGPKTGIDPRLEPRINAAPAMRELQASYQKARSSYDRAYRVAANPNGDPAVRAANLKCREILANIQQTREELRQQLQQEMELAGPSGQSPEKDVQRCRARVGELATIRDTLEAQLGNLKLESNKQMTDEVKLRFYEDRRKFVETNVNLMQQRIDSLDIKQMDQERIRLYDPARKETSPISDKRKMYMAAMPFGVLGVVLALAVLLEIRSGRVADPEFLSTRMPHEIFAIAPLPAARAALGADSDRNEQRLARFVQSLDHLRVALCEGGINGEGRCVMITSATGGEGKTTLSAHLAARCANAGTATLLIDADLRRGSLGRLLDVPPGAGLGDVLAGQVELDGSLISTQAGGFHFLSAGTPGIDPTRVLRSTRLAELIGQLRQMYDLIIIDTPPVLPVADALILGRWADGAVMAARYDASRLPLVERANRQILAAGIPVLGVVLNGVKGQDQAYGNYAYNYASPDRRTPSDDSILRS